MRDQHGIPVESSASTDLKGGVAISLIKRGKGVWKKMFQEECAFHTQALKEGLTGCLPTILPA